MKEQFLAETPFLSIDQGGSMSHKKMLLLSKFQHWCYMDRASAHIFLMAEVVVPMGFPYVGLP